MAQVVCDICKLPIDITWEEHSTMTDWKGNKKLAELFFHAECFKRKWAMIHRLSSIGEKLSHHIKVNYI